MKDLLQFIQSNPDSRELKRALAVKLVFENYPYDQIRKILNVSLGFITKWKQAFIVDGVDGLQLGHKGSEPYLTAEQRQDTISWLKAKNYWDLEELEAYIEDEYNVIFKSKQSYYELFKESDISWKKSQKANPKKNPELVQKKRRNHSTARAVATRDRVRKARCSSNR